MHVYSLAPKRTPKPIPILMFHQGNSDARGELTPIADRLVKSGYRVFMADLRSGGSDFGTNATAAAFTGRQGFYTAYPDLEAALRYVRSATRAKPVVVGSSYSAALAAQLAAKNPQHVSGFVSFSPALLRGCAAEDHVPAIRVPGLAFRALESKIDPAALTANSLWRRHGLEVVELELDGHGASLLLAERSKGDVTPVWNRFLSFIKGLQRKSKA